MTTRRHDPIERTAVPPSPPRVADRMTRPAVTVGWEDPVAQASRLMQAHHFRHLPVIDADQHLVGIVTDGDLAEALAAEGIWDATTAPPTLIVGKVMTWNPVTVPRSCGLVEAVRLMYDRKLSALPVVDGERVVGILCESDILREFAGG